MGIYNYYQVNIGCFNLLALVRIVLHFVNDSV